MTEQTPENTVFTSKNKEGVGSFVKSYKIVVVLAGFFLLLLFAVVVYKLNEQIKLPFFQKGQKVNKDFSQMLKDRFLLVQLGTGFSIPIDTKWEVKLFSSLDNPENNIFSIDSLNKTQIEIEARGSSSLGKIITNPLIKITETKQKKYNNYLVDVQMGKENFGSFSRSVIIAVWKANDAWLKVTFYGQQTDKVEKLFEEFAKQTSFKNSYPTSSRIVKPVLAAEEASPSNLPLREYKEVFVMAEPLGDQITKNDLPYKDGFVKGYKFLAFKSQRLATYADEDRTSNPGSFINSQIFDSNGKILTLEMSTHIELYAPYTGYYYLLVYSSIKQEGKFDLRIEDHDQLSCSTFIKYPDGSEVYLEVEDFDLNKRSVGIDGQVGIVAICPEAFANRLSNFYGGNQALVSSSLYKPLEGFPGESDIPAFEKHDYEVGIQTQNIGINKILVTAVNDSFPANKQIMFPNNFVFFTQEKITIPEVPEINQILEAFELFRPYEGSYNQRAIEPAYVKWTLDSGSEIEALAAFIWIKRDLGGVRTQESAKKFSDKTMDELKQFLVNKGFVLSEKNSYNLDRKAEILQVSGVKEVIYGLQKDDLLCKISLYVGHPVGVYCAKPFGQPAISPVQILTSSPIPSVYPTLVITITSSPTTPPVPTAQQMPTTRTQKPPIDFDTTSENYCFFNKFKMAFILVADKEESVTGTVLQKMSKIQTDFAQDFKYATSNLAEMDISYPLVKMVDKGDLFYYHSNGDVYLNWQSITAEFYQKNTDDFHFLAVYSTIRSPEYQNFKRVHQYIIGNNAQVPYDPDTTALLSTTKKLHGIIFLNDVNMHEGLFSSRALLHELGHNWCCYVGSNFDPEKPEEKGFIQQSIHYYRGLSNSYETSTPMLSDHWILNEDGKTYKRVINLNIMEKYHPFTLYFMGLLKPEQLTEKFMVYDAGLSGDPSFHPDSAKPVFEIGIEDIINRAGPLKCVK